MPQRAGHRPQTASDWLALSDRDALDPAAPGWLRRGMVVVEFALPLAGPTVLLDLRGTGDALSVFADPDAGVALLQRQGGTLRRHAVPGPIVTRQGTARLTFQVDTTTATGDWHMRLDPLSGSGAAECRGTGALPLSRGILQALSSGPRHPAVHWCGVTARWHLPRHAPWIGPNTPIDTKRGIQRAGMLQPGDLIATLDHGFLPLHRLIRHDLPSRGSFAPVLLSSPFFGLTTDLLVSSDQLLLISGPSVEYLYGLDEALIPAGALCDAKVAHRDQRRSLTQAVALDLGCEAILVADGCCLLSAGGPPLLRPVLQEYEAKPLYALLGHMPLRHVG